MTPTSLPIALKRPSAATYIDKVPPGDICQILDGQLAETLPLLQGISEDRSLYRYDSDKWSIREAFGHVDDAERLFVFPRVLVRARSSPIRFRASIRTPRCPYRVRIRGRGAATSRSFARFAPRR